MCSDPPYAGYRYLAEVIATVAWLYFRFPLSLRMVQKMLAARGILVSHEMVRQWGLKFGREIVDRLHRRAPQRGDNWHFDEVVPPSPVRSIISGGPSTATASCSTRRCRAGSMPRRPNACTTNC